MHIAVQAATFANGSANALSASLALQPSIGGAANLSLGPLPPGVGGSAPPDYNASNTTASASGSLSVLATVLSSATLRASVDANLAADASHASASVDNVHFAIPALVAFDAAVVSANATTGCVAGSLAASGTTTLTGASLSLLGSGVAISASPAPNTIINAAGIQVILNEQVVTAGSITVNALHVRINSTSIAAGVVGGDVIVGHAATAIDSTCAVARPDLALAISQPNPAFQVGQASNISVNLTNIGNAPALGVQTVTLALPANFGAPSGFSSGGWACGTTGSTVNCQLPGPFAAGGNSTFVVALTPAAGAAGSQPTFAGNATPASGEASLANNSATMVPSAPVAPASSSGVPDLVLSIGQPVPALAVTQQSTISVNLANVGGALAPPTLRVSVGMPAGFTTAPTFASGSWNCSTSGSSVNCESAAALAAGTSSTFFLVVTASASTGGTRPVFTGIATPAPGETSLDNNSTIMQPSGTVAGGASTVLDSEFNYQDLWWNPNESGWGVTLFQQGDIIFIAMFLYDSARSPRWFVASRMAPVDSRTWSGALYQVNGPDFAVSPFAPGQVSPTQAGNATLVFHTHSTATFTYSVNGATFMKELQRETFNALIPLAGVYNTVTKTETTGCANATSNGTRVATGIVTVTLTGQMLTISDGSPMGEVGCSTSGTLTQSGSLWVVADGRTSCPSGKQSTGTSLFRVTPNTYVEKRVVSSSDDTCIGLVTSAGVK